MVTGDLIDSLYKQDKVIDSIEAKLREAKQKREEIQARLLKKFGVSKLNGARGKLGTAFVKQTPHASMENRPKLLKYIIRNKAWDLFTNHVASKAYFDRVDNGEQVPGVKVFTSTRVSVTKAK
jgi:hypothetical protein